MWRVAFRIASGEMKQRSQRRPLEDDRSYEMPEPPTDLLRVLQQLSPKQRAVIVLHFYAGHSTREVAAILGSTTGTVRVHISQGRKRLRRLHRPDINNGRQRELPDLVAGRDQDRLRRERGADW